MGTASNAPDERPGAMGQRDVHSPRVLADSWGHIDVEGVGTLRDAKLWPGGGRAWDWDETGTRHHPGIQPSDIEELLVHDPEIVVLSRGRELQLETCPETLAALEARKIEVLHDSTEGAIEAYRALARSGRRVAALIHTTC